MIRTCSENSISEIVGHGCGPNSCVVCTGLRARERSSIYVMVVKEKRERVCNGGVCVSILK